MKGGCVIVYSGTRWTCKQLVVCARHNLHEGFAFGVPNTWGLQPGVNCVEQVATGREGVVEGRA